MKFSGIGGQAVIEGVMMRNRDAYAIAVRKSDGGIEVKKSSSKSLCDRNRVAALPIIRGVVKFVESLTMGMSTLNYSASFYEDEEETNEKKDEEKGKKGDGLLMGIVTILSVIIAIGIFMLVPFFISEALRKVIRSPQLRGLLEGVIRVVIFVLYVKLISLMEDIKRVFMYHGAEHKCISCIENGHELNVENARKASMVHKRCGTSFLLIVMFVSILFFMFIVVGNMWLRMALRILLIPIIAGLSFEFILYAGNHDNPVVNVLSKPGLWLQSLTTREPTDDMIEVAMASVNAVFDWSEFLAHYDEPAEEAAATKEKSASKEKTKSREKDVSKEKTKSGEKAVSKEKTKSGERVVSKENSSGIEILNIDDSDEDDEILNALDRYFEAPKPEDQKE